MGLLDRVLLAGAGRRAAYLSSSRNRASPLRRLYHKEPHNYDYDLVILGTPVNRDPGCDRMLWRPSPT